MSAATKRIREIFIQNPFQNDTENNVESSRLLAPETSAADPDPHNFGKPDSPAPDPQQSEKPDPDPNLHKRKGWQARSASGGAIKHKPEH
jgi:hypothetical protein